MHATKYDNINYQFKLRSLAVMIHIYSYFTYISSIYLLLCRKTVFIFSAEDNRCSTEEGLRQDDSKENGQYPGFNFANNLLVSYIIMFWSVILKLPETHVHVGVLLQGTFKCPVLERHKILSSWY